MSTSKQSTKTPKCRRDGRQSKNTKTLITDAKLLKFWRNAAIERAGYACEFPDCNVNYSQLHVHHIYHRAHVSLRYSLANAIVLCPTHHTLGGFSAHKDPTFKDRLLACGVRTPALFEALSAKRNIIQKNTQQFRDGCYQKLKNYL